MSIGNPVGKGEVVSSILTGSTRKSVCLLGFCAPPQTHLVTSRDATNREHDGASRGKSGDFVLGKFA